MKNGKLWIKAVLLMAGSLILGLCLIVCVYLLPTDRMKAHIAESDGVFNYEGIFPQVMDGLKNSQLDNYTDGIMFSIAIHPSSGNVWKDALHNVRYEYEETNMVQGLNDYANDVSEQEPFQYELEYTRYWHGYLVILKPLLLKLNVSEIRLLNMIVQGVLLLFLLYLVQKKLGSCYMIPVFMAVMILNPVVLPLSLQFSWVYYIGLIGSILVLALNCPEGDDKITLLFLGIGMLTNYFDLLTYPLFTLGVPLLLFLLKNKETRLSKQLWLVIGLSLSWGIGYAGMWVGKWVWTFLLGEGNLSKDVSSEILKWIFIRNEPGENVSYGDIIWKTLSVILQWPYIFMILLFTVWCLKRCWSRRKRIRLNEGMLKILPYVLIGMVPFLWFVILINHTKLHYWYSYRALGVTVLAASIALMEFLQAGE